MTIKTLRELRDTTPFRRFEMNLSDGHSIKVATPDHVFFMPNNSEFLVVLPDGGFRSVDSDEVVSAGRGPLRPKAL